MKHLLNKGLLLFSAFVIMYIQKTEITQQSITALLLSLIACSIYPALSGITTADSESVKPAIYICEALICTYFLSALWLQPIYMFASIVCYDLYRYRQRLSPFIFAAISIYFLISNPTAAVIFQLCLVGFSIITSIYCCRIDSLHNELVSMRDNSAEHDMLAAQNTRQLLENQDNMILTATLSERNRIAREIHDNVGHMLTRSILQTGAIKVINKDERLDKPLTQLQATLDTAMDSMRKSVHDLHDDAVDLRTAINDIVNRVQNIDIRTDYDMSDRLPKEIKYSFINIVKEAVNNTLKHSNGNHMDIRMREHPAFYQLYIADNGHNIPSLQHSSGAGGGMGLNGIHERVNMLGGTMKVTTDNGFCILITIMKKGETL